MAKEEIKDMSLGEIVDSMIKTKKRIDDLPNFLSFDPSGTGKLGRDPTPDELAENSNKIEIEEQRYQDLKQELDRREKAYVYPPTESIARYN